MVDIGRMNDLKLLRLSPQGAVLDGAEAGEILLPAGQVPLGCAPGDPVRVFVSRDAEDRLVATTQAPLVLVGEVANLKIVSVKDAGAFLAWGMPKDLLLPWAEVPREQKHWVVEGKRILVAVFRDEQGRVAASARLDEFLLDEGEGLAEGDKVDLFIFERTDIGMRVVVNHRYWGLIHQNEIFTTLQRGERREGFVKALRPDRKLNISLTAPGYAKADTVGQTILDVLKRRGGFLAVSDKSRPEAIYALFGVSKKAFKLALGALYKSRQVVIEADGIRLVQKDS